VLFNFPEYVFGKEKAVLSWPHWLCKYLYSQKGIMFGKFWIGEKNLCSNMEMMPIPTKNFISIRNFFNHRDLKLLSEEWQKKIIEDLRASVTDEGALIAPEILVNVSDPKFEFDAFSMFNFYSICKAESYYSSCKRAV